jgi:hypothetical protein
MYLTTTVFCPKRRNGLCQHYLGIHSLKNDARLVLDARDVYVRRLFNLMLVTLSSLQPFFCNGLKKGWDFSDTVGTEDPGIQEERLYTVPVNLR